VLFVTLIVAANHNSKSLPSAFSWIPGRPLGRYVNFMIPLIVLAGFLGLSDIKDVGKDEKIKEGEDIFKIKLFKRKSVCIFAPLLIFSSFLVMFPLLPVNNLSLSWIGIINVFLNLVFFKRIALGGVYFSWGITIFFALLFLGLLVFVINFLDKLTFKRIFIFFMIFFIFINGLNFVLTGYNSGHFWNNGEQNRVGVWFNDYDKNFSNVLFDEDDCTLQVTKLDQRGICDKSHLSTLMGFWMNDEIRVGSIERTGDFDYVVSKKVLKYPILKETSDGVHIYLIDT